MSPVAYPAEQPGGISGRGDVIVVDHTTDNNLMTFRMTHADVRMLAAEKDFKMDGHASALAPSSSRRPTAPPME